MTRYLVRRAVQIVVTLFVFLTLVFFLIQAQPGDFSTFYVLDPSIPPESKKAIQALFGIDKPVWQQYLSYLGNFLHGNLGSSYSHFPREVTDVLLERLPRTLLLFLTATVISFYLGFALGKIIAWRRGKAIEYVSTIGGVFLYTAFTPWLALIMLWLFALRFGWFPAGKFVTPTVWSGASVDANLVIHRLLLTATALTVFVLIAVLVLQRLRVRRAGLIVRGLTAAAVVLAIVVWNVSGIGVLAFDIIKHMVLPVAVLTLVSFAGTMLLTRNSMLETMREDYVMVARAKGLPEKAVRDKHAARNAMLPVVTSFVFSLAFAIDGGVIIESIFAWPGMGFTLLDATVKEDLPLAVGAFLLTGSFALVAHLVADVLYAYLDPRIRYQ